jgi:CubicO group peptidase (beta-lactamase class C family)
LTESEAAAARTGAAFRQFLAWLEVFNSADRTRIGEFLKTSFPAQMLEAEMSFRKRTTGFEFRRLEQASSTSITGLMQERNADQFVRFSLEIEPAEPHRIKRFTLVPVPRPADSTEARLNEPELITALSAKLKDDVENDRFSGAILLAKLDEGATKVLFSEAYGLQDREKKLANTLDTRFHIGSMTKMFTAISILQLVQAGKINLMDPVSKYIPDYPNKDIANKVTIHHLLTHTGGTGDIFGPELSAHRLEVRSLDDYVNLFGKRGPAFEPGSVWAYSNYGMVLLGVVIERVSGQSYYDYVADHIYKPAEMTRSGSEPENTKLLGRAIGYMRDEGANTWTPNTETLGYRGSSAGGSYSTVGDLLKFAVALMDHRLLSVENTQLLITGKVDTGKGFMYGYGFQDWRKNGAGAIGHNGGAPGMNGELRIYPQTGYVVAVLSNLDPPAAQQVSAFLDLRLPQEQKQR